EGEEASVPREHDLPELLVRDVVVADERDAPDGNGRVLLDGELEGDLVLPLRFDLVADLGEEVALLGVLVAELLHAAADGRVAQDRAGLDLDRERLGEVLAVNLAVAGELDRLDARALADEHPQAHAVVAAGEIDLDVIEQAGVPELAHVARQPLGGERPAD